MEDEVKFYNTPKGVLFQEARKKKEAEFKAMSPGEKRVAICKDAIEQIEAERYLATPGTYFKYGKLEPILAETLKIPAFSDHIQILDAGGELQLQDVLANVENCSVCAVGALFASTVSIFNDMKVSETEHGDDFLGHGIEGAIAYDKLTQFFDSEDLYQIECAFEQNSPFPGTIHPIARDRLLMILKNIVDNKGEFTPPPEWIDEEGEDEDNDDDLEDEEEDDLDEDDEEDFDDDEVVAPNVDEGKEKP